MTNESATKACSLALELEQLEHAAEAVTFLVNLVRDRRTSNDDEAKRLPILSAVVASMLGARLRDLRRVVRGQRDPGEFWSEHCDTPPIPKTTDDSDVRFPAWSHGERAHRAGTELTQLKTGASSKRDTVPARRRRAGE